MNALVEVESAIMSLVEVGETTLTSESHERGESAKLEGTFGFHKVPQNLPVFLKMFSSWLV